MTLLIHDDGAAGPFHSHFPSACITAVESVEPAFSTAAAYAYMASYCGTDNSFGVSALLPNFFSIASRKALFASVSRREVKMRRCISPRRYHPCFWLCLHRGRSYHRGSRYLQRAAAW